MSEDNFRTYRNFDIPTYGTVNKTANILKRNLGLRGMSNYNGHGELSGKIDANSNPTAYTNVSDLRININRNPLDRMGY